MRKLKKWNSDRLKGSLAATFHRKEQEINQLNMDSSMVNELMVNQAEKELDLLLIEEEAYWRNKAREDWLKCGDRNTKWFHSRANQRRKRNRIEGLLNDDNEWVSDCSEIGKLATNYFNHLFGTSRPRHEAIKDILIYIENKIPEESKSDMDRPFTKEEVEVAVKSMNPSKAPGPDGAHAFFFQK